MYCSICPKMYKNALLLWALYVTAEGVFVNDYDGPFTFMCPKPTMALTRIYSEHNNGPEDRRFDLTCGDVPADTSGTANCFWTDFVNRYDELVHYSCPTNHYLSGIGSEHDNGAEDRRFKFYCCQRNTVHMEDCSFSGWTNDYDKPSDFTVPAGSVIKGVISQHNSGPEDRMFEFETCKVFMHSDEAVVG